MEWQSLNVLREKFLSFFESKSHTRLPSAALVPQGDNSLLLINSGMAPLKKFFLGQAVPPNKRVTTCQKCIRTPDIERVGKTSRHGTYFEMLGNFSFGDYFKNEATAWAWEFFVDVLQIPVEKLYVSVYEEDDEAYDIWTKKIGVDPTHMTKLGKADNFWEHGSGPCGPCSEIYFDRGEGKGCGSPDCKVGCDCDRFVEVWNLVFTQFDSDGNGNYAKMANPNIDTGMGLERLACVLQEVDNLFEVDTVQNIMKHICKISGVEYKKDEKTDVSLRVITDHIRSTTFMVGDGVMPSNEGRGYVLRRLLRRAARHGRLIGINEPFLNKVCDTVIAENKSAYPELAEKSEYIKKIILVEEENFAKTVDKGLELLTRFIESDEVKNSKVLSGEDTFKLSDTYGFPLDLTMEIASEKGIQVDVEKFDLLVKEQREKARADHLAKASSSWADNSINVSVEKTIFTGYSEWETDSKILAIYNGQVEVETAIEGDSIVVILDKTPFYAEGGGQVGDTGIIVGNATLIVDNTMKTEDGHFLHIVTVENGSVKKGDVVKAKIDAEKRSKIMRNHTSAHLLQSALRNVLGEHVHQAGQLVDAERCRFDFSHFSALTSEEMAKIEDIINGIILSSVNVDIKEMPIEEAKKSGAMALFGEKYGNVVRVVNVKDTSVEFCGGTHVDNTAKIGLFKILSETSVAAGVRRIEAVTGDGVLSLLNDYKSRIVKSAQVLKLTNPFELENKCNIVMNDMKTLERQIEALNQEIADIKIQTIFNNEIKEVKGVKYLVANLKNTKTDILRQIADKLKDKYPDIVSVIAGEYEGKGSLLCVSGKPAIEKGVLAGKVIKNIAELTGGKGGGRPDSAMAGVGDLNKVDDALGQVEKIISELVG